MTLSAEEQLSIISRAWGKQRGYAFFPTIRGDATERAERIRGYNEHKAFLWPDEKDAILEHIEEHQDKNDLYWCPSLFEKKRRSIEFAMDEHSLWADLDEVDPRDIDEEYKPTIAWETSPGRYQALWLITGGDLQGASWPGNENQRLTYMLGADHSGWDTTQLLRLPAGKNFKPEHRAENDDEAWEGRLLWKNGPRYPADHFTDLPEVSGAADASLASDVIEDQIKAVDRLEVWGKARLKVSKDVRELVSARSTGGSDRSDKLWQIERDLADAGLTVAEIVAIVRETVWNKFSGRADELKRLVSEAAKAVAERSDETEKRLEKEREEKPKPANLFTMVRDAEPPVWLVKDILTMGSCGFLAGEPKSYKSWCALDLALSVATGAPFLGAFDVVDPGPVLYIQEEDPLPTLKDRLGKIAPGKTQDKVSYERDEDTGEKRLVWAPADENKIIPPLAAIVRVQFVISDAGWQAWLDEVLEDGYQGDGPHRGEKYKMVVIDTLGTTAGEVDENRASELNVKVLTPLRQVAEKHGVAVQVVHHLRKGREGDNSRAGQRMLGSVALHAWSESSIYFTHGRLGSMKIETESKHAQSLRFEIKNLRKKNEVGSLVWEPEVNLLSEEDAAKEAAGTRGRGAGTGARGTGNTRPGQGTRRKMAREAGLDPDEVAPIRKEPGQSRGPGRPPATEPAALKALKLLTQSKAKSYSTHEVKDKMAEMLGQKPTQTLYLRAYQQLKKLYETDAIGRVDKNWVLPEVGSDADALMDEAIETLI